MAVEKRSGDRTKQPKAAHRTRYGEGSFYYRATDGRWVGVIEAGWTREGKRRKVTVSHKLEDVAWNRFMTKRLEITQKGIPSENARAGTTVKTWCEAWLQQRLDSVKPKTYQSEKSVIVKWVIPTLGRVKLAQLTPDHIRSLTRIALEAGSSTTNARYIQRIFTQALKAAKTDGLTVPDLVFLVAKPEARVSDRQALPWNSAQAVLTVARDTLPHWSRWALALALGLRQGEALGLRWQHVDLANRTINLDWSLHQLTRVNGEYHIPSQYEAIQLTGAYHLLRPKSRAGKRVVPLPDTAAAILDDWRQKSVDDPNPHDLVWPAKSGKPKPEKADRAEWFKLQAATGVKKGIKEDGEPRYYVPHELRHTTVSYLLAQGVQPAVIEAIVGHDKLVENYVHVDLDQMRSALELTA